MNTTTKFFVTNMYLDKGTTKRVADLSKHTVYIYIYTLARINMLNSCAHIIYNIYPCRDV